MKKIVPLLVIVIVLVGGFMLLNKDKQASRYQESYQSGSDDTNFIELKRINDDVWLHTTYTTIQCTRYSANGMVVVTKDGLVLLDTPWTNQQTKELIQLCSGIFENEFTLAIVTHAHNDNIGGISTLIDEEIKVISTKETLEEAKKNGFELPNPKLEKYTEIHIGDTTLKTYYPGEGHAKDNIVVYLSDYRILFGGCLIKSSDAMDLGNTGQANLVEWPLSILNVEDRFPKVKLVVPGHGEIGDKELFEHTKELLKNIKWIS